MITLGDDPYSAEYFARFADLTDSIGPLLADDPEPYVRYWLHKRRKVTEAEVTPLLGTEALGMATSRKVLAESIRDGGYKIDGWKDSGRNLDPAKGQGRITVNIGADGTIYSWDGLHRSAILKHLGRPVEVEVFKRDARWLELSEFHKTLYQPFPHPDFAGRKVTRPGHVRYAAISNAISACGAKSVIIVGACTGWGVERLTYDEVFGQVHGIEPHKDRFPLAKSFLEKSGRGTVEQIAAHEFTRYGDFGATVGLSVYHHVATSVERWREVCKLLAACPVHILELAADDAPQWHDKFREESNGLPRSVIFDELCKAGNYGLGGCVFNDPAYANRQTISLVRKKL